MQFRIENMCPMNKDNVFYYWMLIEKTNRGKEADATPTASIENCPLIKPVSKV